MTIKMIFMLIQDIHDRAKRISDFVAISQVFNLSRQLVLKKSTIDLVTTLNHELTGEDCNISI